jgi:hypothetical protein
MSCNGGHLGFPIGIKNRFGKGHSNDHSFTVSLVSEKKIFEISANQSILMALAAL